MDKKKRNALAILFLTVVIIFTVISGIGQTKDVIIKYNNNTGCLMGAWALITETEYEWTALACTIATGAACGAIAGPFSSIFAGA